MSSETKVPPVLAPCEEQIHIYGFTVMAEHTGVYEFLFFDRKENKIWIAKLSDKPATLAINQAWLLNEKFKSFHDSDKENPPYGSTVFLVYASVETQKLLAEGKTTIEVTHTFDSNKRPKWEVFYGDGLIKN